MSSETITPSKGARHAVRTVRGREDQAQRRHRGQPRLRKLHRLRGRSGSAGLPADVHGRASLYRPGPGIGLDDAAGLPRRQDPEDPSRHGGGRAALAQSRAGGRAGRHARPLERRTLRFRRRQRLPPGRVRRLLHSHRRGHRALRRGDGDHPQGVDQRGPVQPSRQALALRQYRRRARAPAAPAPADLAGRRQSRQRPPGGARGLQSPARPARPGRPDHPAHRHLPRGMPDASAAPTTPPWWRPRAPCS